MSNLYCLYVHNNIRQTVVDDDDDDDNDDILWTNIAVSCAQCNTFDFEHSTNNS